MLALISSDLHRSYMFLHTFFREAPQTGSVRLASQTPPPSLAPDRISLDERHLRIDRAIRDAVDNQPETHEKQREKLS